MNEKGLGKLVKVDLKEVWKDEARDFTPWLATEENLSLLGEEIGINIKLIETEASVGSFNVDILAEEENTGKKIVIENQLTQTNHDHLGKVITYASGYDAPFAVWVVKEVRDQHKQAIDWLNEHTDSEANFFLVKIELWKIGTSSVAPKFIIVSQPNDWTKTIKATGLSSLAQQELDFLRTFISYCKENKTNLKLSRPAITTPAYYSISMGTGVAWIAIKINNDKEQLRLDIYFADKDIFKEVSKNYRNNIEQEIGYKLEWNEMPEYKGALVGISKKFKLKDENNWNGYFKWLKENAEKFYKVFPKYIKKAKITVEKEPRQP